MGRLDGLKDEANKAIVKYLEAKLEHLEGQRELALLAMAKVEEGQAKYSRGGPWRRNRRGCTQREPSTE